MDVFKVACIFSVILCLFFVIATADKVPVLMWSPARPLSDLPQAFAGNSIDHRTFQDKYLSPLTSESGNHLVVFVQDKLHMNDFSKYADVYNQFSDGGAFKNIKSFMDEHFSVNLPSVNSPKLVINKLLREFSERVHQVTSPSQVPGLALEKDKSYLILVLLPASTSAKNEEKAISENDEMIGKVVKELDKRSIHYTALYTGESSEQPAESVHTGRRLLADDETNQTYTFINFENKLYFYSRDIVLVLKEKTGEKEVQITNMTFPLKDYNTTGTEVLTNNSVVFQLSYPSVTANSSISGVYEYNVSFSFTAVLDSRFDWHLENFTLTVFNISESTPSVVFEDQMMELKDLLIVVPQMFSYHCSKLTINPKNTTGVFGVLQFNGFQFQPFGIHHNEFSAAWDCIGFFTTPIWMGLFPVFILLIILFFGMYMLMNLSTMDRFDDPKAKTISVNTQE